MVINDKYKKKVRISQSFFHDCLSLVVNNESPFKSSLLYSIQDNAMQLYTRIEGAHDLLELIL
jgi:hypothetical protein